MLLLDGKNAIIYGAGGAVGGAIARAFAAQGATVHLTGPRLPSLERLAGEINGRAEAGRAEAGRAEVGRAEVGRAEAGRAEVGRAEVAVVDALDEAAIDEHAERVGRIDVSVNVSPSFDVQGTPLVEMSADDYLAPVTLPVRSRFLTSRAAARRMIPQRSGVILFFGGEGDRQVHRRFELGGLVTGLAAVEAMRRQLAGELGRYGIRVVTLQTAGIAESLPADMPGRDELAGHLAAPSPLDRTATLAEVGHAAVFAASDWGASLTGTQLNITCGAYMD